MSLAAHPVLARRRLPPWLMRCALVLAAIVLVAGLAGLLVAALMPNAAAPMPRNPFGIGLREAPPSMTGLGAIILSYQASFNRALEAALIDLKHAGGAPWLLIGLGFAYGVFHAAGPGHGKGVIAAYLVSNERALIRGLGVGLAAALLQGLVAVALVGIAAILFRATAPTVTRVTDSIETASFAVVALFGLLLTWRKAGRLAAMLDGRPRSGPAICEAEACGHVHMPPPEVMARSSLGDLAGVVLAAGLRPCAGAILVLVFALSQRLFWEGVASVVAMSLGTALTTGSIATLAVFAKRLALRLAGRRNRGGEIAGAGFELLLAAFVVVLGGSLLLGLSAGFIAG